MPSTYSNSLRLELQADNENQGNWGSVTNRNLGTLLESAVSGVRAITLPDTDYTLSALNGSDDEARYAYLVFSGTLTTTRNVIVPTPSKLYAVRNGTNQSLVIKTATGTGITVPSGASTLLYSNGTNVLDMMGYLSSLTVGGTAVISTSSANPALRITQTGTGEALRVEDEANPDATPFVIDAAGNVGIGTSAPTGGRLHVTQTTGSAIFGTTQGGTGFGGSFENNDGGTTRFVRAAGAGGNGVLAAGVGTTTQFLLDTAGNLGLGVTPSAWRSADKALQVRSTIVENVNNAAAVFGLNYYRDSSAVDRYINTDRAAQIVLNAGANGSIAFSVAPSGTAGAPIPFTQAMTLTQGGNLLVGTTDNPGHRLLVVSQASVSQFAARFNGTDGTNSAVFDIAGSGINPVLEAVGARDMLFRTNNTERARITSAGYFKASNTGTYAFPATPNTDLTNDPSHSFTLTVNGYAVIAANTSDTTSGHGVLSGVKNSSARLYEGRLNNSTVYQVLANGNVQNASGAAISPISSDARIKQVTDTLEDALGVITKLRPVKFDYMGKHESFGKNIYGFIAQEVGQAKPDAVMDSGLKDDDIPDLKTYDASFIVPYLVKALQQSNDRVAALESRLAALEAK